MNNDKLIAARCLIEAANLLDESAGKNGAGRRLANVIADNDLKEYNELKSKNKHRNDQFIKAGYPEKCDSEDYYPYESVKNRDNANKAYSTARHGTNARCIYTDPTSAKFRERGLHDAETYNANSGFRTWNNTPIENKLSNKQKSMHSRINNRAKSKNECISLLLTEAANLLDTNISKSYKLYKDGIHEEISSKKEFMELVHKYSEDALRSCYYHNFMNIMKYDNGGKLLYDEFKKNFKSYNKPEYKEFETNGKIDVFYYTLYNYLDSKNTGDGSYKREIPMSIIFAYSFKTKRFHWSFDGSD